MPRYDSCHDQVINALRKVGWSVARKQFRLYADDRQVFVDLRANRGWNGNQQQILLVEIKCFPDPDDTTQELYTAFGQYILYRAVISELNIPAELYLAVPSHIFKDVFDPTALRATKDNRIQMVIINLETETIEQWIP